MGRKVSKRAKKMPNSKKGKRGASKSKTPVMDRKRLRVFNSMAELDEADGKYWQPRTPAERMRELERLRQFNWGYGNGKPYPKLERTIRVVNLEDS